MDALTKNNQTNAATILRQRIVQCESADILATKEFAKMDASELQKMLLATKNSWPSFNLHIKGKLYKFSGHKSLSAAAPLKVFPVITKLVHIVPPELGHERSVKQFNMLEPELSAWFRDFLTELEEVMGQCGLLTDGASTSIVIGFSDALSKEEDGAKACAANPELKKLKERAED